MRKPMDFLQTVSTPEMLTDLRGEKFQSTSPDSNNNMGVARVIAVDGESLKVTLRIVGGTSEEFVCNPTHLTAPGGGRRHMMMAIPEVGDHCLISWMTNDSSQGARAMRTPVILTWLPGGVWAGRDWLTTSPFTIDEYDMGSVKDRELVKGNLSRVRHKLITGRPGNIIASSSQGSDLILAEDATLSNRRGNEIILRDADQTIISRAVSHHTAGAGVRCYAGPIHRDARLLEPTMTSDGKDWESFSLVGSDGQPLTEADLPVSSTPAGFLTPARKLARRMEDSGVVSSSALSGISDRLDPYTFLRNGSLIDSSGYALDPTTVEAQYGGKRMLRVSVDGTNSATSEDPVLTEWRFEARFQTDLTLPVTERTDGFDADRLPEGDPNLEGSAPKSPDVEMVLGSVVGNDPYSVSGRASYGLPLKANVFGTPTPVLEPVNLRADALQQHLATLLRINPVGGVAPTAFIAMTKAGQLRANLTGPAAENSAEIALTGGLRLRVGGDLQLEPNGALSFIASGPPTGNNVGINLESPKGAVNIVGGGTMKDGNGDQRLAPSVNIRGENGVNITSSRQVLLQADNLELQGRTSRIQGSNEVDITAGDRVGVQTKSVDLTVTGKMTSVFTGPRDFLPTNGALDDRTYLTIPGLNAVKELIVFGDRSEEIVLGNHFHTIRAGNYLQTINVGTHSVTVGLTNTTQTPATWSATTTGAATLTSSAGPATVTGTAAATLTALGGPATVRGTVGVILSAPADFNIGPIITAGSLDPLTGLPFATFGMGAKFHIVSP